MSVHTKREITWKEGGERQSVVTESDKRCASLLTGHPDAKVKVLGYGVRWREGTRNRGRTFDRKPDAVRFDAEARRRRQLGDVVPARTGGETLKEFTVAWLGNRQNITEDTRANDTMLLEAHLVKHLGHVPVRELRLDTLEAWQRDRLAEDIGPSSHAKVIGLLRQMLKRAVARDLLSRNLALDLEKPESEKRIPTPATPEQIEAIRSYFLDREEPMIGDATLVSILAYAGPRPKEALRLTSADIDSPTILFRSTKNQVIGVVRPPRQVFQDIAEWKLASPSPFGLLFPRHKDGEVWTKNDWDNWRNRRFTPAAEAAGLDDFNPYDLRHSAASLKIAEGKPITEIAYELRHKPAMLLDNYAHLIEQARDRESASAEEWIAEARAGRSGEAAANG